MNKINGFDEGKNDVCFEIDTKFGIIDYILLVEDIASGFFGTDEVYKPHMGKINAMRLFYNLCVKKCKFDDKYGHNVTTPQDLEEIVMDKDFITAYNKAFEFSDYYYFETDFMHAYYDALEIVDNNKSSMGRITQIIEKINMNLSTLFTDEIVEKISDFFAKISSEDFNAESLIKAYANQFYGSSNDNKIEENTKRDETIDKATNKIMKLFKK